MRININISSIYFSIFSSTLHTWWKSQTSHKTSPRFYISQLSYTTHPSSEIPLQPWYLRIRTSHVIPKTSAQTIIPSFSSRICQPSFSYIPRNANRTSLPRRCKYTRDEIRTRGRERELMIGLRHTDDCGCNGVSVSPVALMGRECDCRIAKGVWEYWFGGMIELWVCSKYITHMVERKWRRSEFKVWELENALCKNFLIFRLKVRRRLRNLQVLCAEKFSALFKTQLRNPTGKCRWRVVLQIF